MNEQEYVKKMIKTEEDRMGYEKFGLLWFVKDRTPENVPPSHNDSSSATRPTGRVDCNQSAMAGFAAAHG